MKRTFQTIYTNERVTTIVIAIAIAVTEIIPVREMRETSYEWNKMHFEKLPFG